MKIDFEKGNGLIPVIIQDNRTLQVLMLGYMNQEAYLKTEKDKVVTFFSRSRNQLWTKGETSGNYLYVKDIITDCDSDAILVKVIPAGPVCHTGNRACFDDNTWKGFIYRLEEIISQRIDNNTSDSYTNKLYRKGVNKVAQKVGEEAVELVIEAMNNNDELFRNEAADLMYHILILLKTRQMTFSDIEKVLESRHKE